MSNNDLLQQFLELSDDKQEQFAELLLKTISIFPAYWKHRCSDFPSVISTPSVCGGSPRIIRTRIPIWLLQHMRQIGFSEAKILECYPTLTANDLAQAWAYVAAHQTEINKEIEENEQY